MTARAALYLRVSTLEQAEEGFSLDAQLEKLQAFAKIHGWTVAGEYVDEGQSGRTTKRSEYQRMFAERDSWDVLLVLKMDRIHRSSRNFMAMMDDLKQHGKEFVSVMESLDTSTAMGRFVMDIIQRIGQLESEQIGERVIVGMEEKAKQNAGGLGGPAPFGYRWEHGILQPEPDEAKVVRIIFKAHNRGRGKGFTQIARDLNEAKHRTRAGLPFSYWNVREILHNPVYNGHLKWRGIMQLNQHKPLVGEG